VAYDANQENLRKLRKIYAEGVLRTVFFVGAGCSAEVGLPTWSILKEKMFESVDNSVRVGISDDSEMEEFRHLEILYESDDFWSFFSHASKNWPTTYGDVLTTQFDEIIAHVPTPQIYKKIWEMSKVRQIFTTNVDGLISRAFFEVKNSPIQLMEYDGFSAADSISFLARNAYCAINLHGTYTTKSKWIMHGEQRSALIKSTYGDKYTRFITRLFSEYVVIFVGINPMDAAISPFIKRASECGQLSGHFWICPHPDSEKKRWAENNSVRIISYTPQFDETGAQIHAQEICAIIDDVDRFISKEERVSLPNTSTMIEPSTLEGANSVMSAMMLNKRETVDKLSGALTFIGENKGYESNSMKDFLSAYSVPIQFSANINPNTDGYNYIGDFKIVDSIQTKGLSSVWSAKHIDGNDFEYYVIKLLNDSGVRDLVERESFRRGIESLFLLSQAGINVGPKYKYHFEVPLSLVMETISGTTLDEFRKTYIDPTHDILISVFLNVCKATLRCHSSDGQVLHRDIKPTNVMLENWYIGYDHADAKEVSIRLLNFDLSWHRFTSGNTKSIGADDIGYYSPEQRNSANTEPPRYAATDVYMLGMLLFFIVTGENPPDGGATVQNWEEHISKKTKYWLKENLLWKRISRLITQMTKKEPACRCDLNTAIAEIESLICWISGDMAYVDDDLFVENLAISTDRHYIWNSIDMTATVGQRSDINFLLQYQQRGRKINFKFFRTRTESDNRSAFGERLRSRLQSVTTLLESQGWEVSQSGNKGLDASIRVEKIKENHTHHAQTWKSICDQLMASFE